MLICTRRRAGHGARATCLGQRPVLLLPRWRPDLAQACSLAPSGKSMGNRACEAQKPPEEMDIREAAEKDRKQAPPSPAGAKWTMGTSRVRDPRESQGISMTPLPVFPT